MLTLYGKEQDMKLHMENYPSFVRALKNDKKK